MKITFKWSEAKALANYRKHGVRFELAAQVFLDPADLSYMERIVFGEYRWHTIGTVQNLVTLTVAHTLDDEIGHHELIRIISARRASTKEKNRYERQVAHPYA